MTNYIVAPTKREAASWAAYPSVLPPDDFYPVDPIPVGWVHVHEPLPTNGVITSGHVWYTPNWRNLPDYAAIVRSVLIIARANPETFTFEVVH